ncbi:MAG: hypothetical protein AABY64_13070 [Bdellovibrionota bacterium]
MRSLLNAICFLFLTTTVFAQTQSKENAQVEINNTIEQLNRDNNSGTENFVIFSLTKQAIRLAEVPLQERGIFPATCDQNKNKCYYQVEFFMIDRTIEALRKANSFTREQK